MKIFSKLEFRRVVKFPSLSSATMLLTHLSNSSTVNLLTGSGNSSTVSM